MSFKDKYKKNLGDKKSMLGYRYTASKMVFIATLYLFFMTFFLTAAGYYDGFFSQILAPSFVLALVSLSIFSVLYGMMRIKNRYVGYAFGAIISVFSTATLLILFL